MNKQRSAAFTCFREYPGTSGRHDPNFIAAPEPRKWSTQVVRNFWRDYSGNWFDGQAVRDLRSVDGQVIVQDDCDNFQDSYRPLHGDM